MQNGGCQGLRGDEVEICFVNERFQMKRIVELVGGDGCTATGMY